MRESILHEVRIGEGNVERVAARSMYIIPWTLDMEIIFTPFPSHSQSLSAQAHPRRSKALHPINIPSDCLPALSLDRRGGGLLGWGGLRRSHRNPMADFLALQLVPTARSSIGPSRVALLKFWTPTDLVLASRAILFASHPIASFPFVLSRLTL
jgi:hypothetical protein